MAKFVAAVLQILLPWILTEYTRARQKSEKREVKEEEIDEALKGLKEATVKAQDGKPMTPEQVKEMRDAYRKLIRT